MSPALGTNQTQNILTVSVYTSCLRPAFLIPCALLSKTVQLKSLYLERERERKKKNGLLYTATWFLSLIRRYRQVLLERWLHCTGIQTDIRYEYIDVVSLLGSFTVNERQAWSTLYIFLSFFASFSLVIRGFSQMIAWAAVYSSRGNYGVP